MLYGFPAEFPATVSCGFPQGPPLSRSPFFRAGLSFRPLSKDSIFTLSCARRFCRRDSPFVLCPAILSRYSILSVSSHCSLRFSAGPHLHLLPKDFIFAMYCARLFPRRVILLSAFVEAQRDNYRIARSHSDTSYSKQSLLNFFSVHVKKKCWKELDCIHR